jgi:hypothetical protein
MNLKFIVQDIVSYHKFKLVLCMYVNGLGLTLRVNVNPIMKFICTLCASVKINIFL